MSSFSRGTILGFEIGELFKFEIRVLGPKKMKEELEESREFKEPKKKTIFKGKRLTVKRILKETENNDEGNN